MWCTNDDGGNCADDQKICFAVIMATYQRTDGSTPAKLTTALKCVLNQSYANWKLYIVGDKYEDESELRHVVTSVMDRGGADGGSSKVTVHNMEEAGERGKLTGKVLWCHAGATAMNLAISMAVSNGGSWVAHLDDDDEWEGDHLLRVYNQLMKFPSALATCSLAQHCAHRVAFTVLPRAFRTPGRHPDPRLNAPRPQGSDAIHSALCFNAALVPNRYTIQTSKPSPADARFWHSLRSINSVIVPHLTVHHLYESSSRQSPLSSVRLCLCSETEGCGPDTHGWTHVRRSSNLTKPLHRGDKVIEMTTETMPLPLGSQSVRRLWCCPSSFYKNPEETKRVMQPHGLLEEASTSSSSSEQSES